MLLRLVRTYLRPYAAPLGAVVALQFVGTMAALYLPSLNADIICSSLPTASSTSKNHRQQEEPQSADLERPH